MDSRQARLTPRQQRVYAFIVDRVTQRGAPPTIREIGRELGVNSPNGVMCHLKALESKGYIRRDSFTARGIEIVGQNTELLTLLKEIKEIFHKVAGQTTANPLWTRYRDRLAVHIAKLETPRA